MNLFGISTISPPFRGIFSSRPEVIEKRILRKFNLKKASHSFSSSSLLKCYEPPPEPKNKKTLILDLDETLIHFSTSPPPKGIEFFKIDSDIIIYKRPHLDDFLEFATKNFDVFVFTYGNKAYANPIIDEICPKLDENHRLFRDSCELKKGQVFKDLSMFERDETKVILVDDNKAALKFHPKNTLQISSWEGSPMDNDLTKWLIPILIKCINADDVRDIISNAPRRKKNISYNLTFHKSI
jgi:Dullard-like phosphatase family protein